MSKIRNKTNQTTLRGIVLPIQWDETGNVLSISINTYDEKEYIIDFGGNQNVLKSHLTELVEIQGSIIQRTDRHPYVKVASYRLLAPLEDTNVESLIGDNNFPS